MKIRRYSELITLNTFEDRFRYLKLDGIVGSETFGFDRYMNQRFYSSRQWKDIRDEVIIRDHGCDLGIEDREIRDRIYIHHMNPISAEDIANQSELLLDPEYLICVTFATHQAIHFGDENLLISLPTPRMKNDTCPWKH